MLSVFDTFSFNEGSSCDYMYAILRIEPMDSFLLDKCKTLHNCMIRMLPNKKTENLGSRQEQEKILKQVNIFVFYAFN